MRERDARYGSATELRRLRASLGVRQIDAAQVCGVDPRTYQRWEAGELRVRRVYLDRLAASGSKDAKER